MNEYIVNKWNSVVTENDIVYHLAYVGFGSLEDLRKQGATYLKRSNRIPMAVLGYLTQKKESRVNVCIK